MAMGQGTTITLGSVTAPAAGAAISVPINVTNFTSVGSITLKVAYDTAVVTYAGLANAATGISFTSNAANGVITLIWYDATGLTPLSITSGKLVDINFTYKKNSGAVTFNTSLCEITTGAGVVIGGITYVNGSINTGSSGSSTSISIGSAAAPAVGAAFDVPVNVANFTNVGAITLKIGYDTAVVTFTGVSNAPAGVTFTSNGANGVINLIWYDASGNTPLSIGTGKLVDLGFTYKGGAGTLAFNNTQCEITTGAGIVISGIVYGNGSITSSASTSMKIDSVNAPAVGAAFSIPVTAKNLTAVGSITLKIGYNAAVATFVNATNAPAGVTFTGNAANGVITLIWYDASGNTPLTLASGKLLDLNFTYLTGSSPLTFSAADCEVTTGAGAVITGIAYINGSITNINLKPVLSPVAAITKAARDTVRFTVSATDANPADVLTYSAPVVPTGATFTPATRTFLWVPALAQYGTYPVKVFVSDGQLKDSITVSITVTRLPIVVLNAIPNQPDMNDANRTFKRKLTSPAVFGNNVGTLTYTASSDKAAYASVNIIAPDTLVVKGLKPSAGVAILITVVARDTNANTGTTTFNVTITGTVGVEEVTGVPTEFSVSQNYPNPFNPSTTIKFGLPAQAPVTMEVYNVLGVKVRTLINGEVMNAAVHQIQWNGKDDAGVSVSSGVYIYRVKAGAFQMSKKMMMLK